MGSSSGCAARRTSRGRDRRRARRCAPTLSTPSTRKPRIRFHDDHRDQVRPQLGEHVAEAAAAARRHRHGQQHPDETEEGAGRADAEAVAGLELQADGRGDHSGQQVRQSGRPAGRAGARRSCRTARGRGRIEGEVQRMRVQPHGRQQAPPLTVGPPPGPKRAGHRTSVTGEKARSPPSVAAIATKMATMAARIAGVTIDPRHPRAQHLLQRRPCRERADRGARRPARRARWPDGAEKEWSPKACARDVPGACLHDALAARRYATRAARRA